MNTTNDDVFAALKTLREAYPDEPRIDIWIEDHRGHFSYTCYIKDREEIGLDSVFSSGDTPMDAVEQMIQKNPASSRDPDMIKGGRIADLKRQLAELEATTEKGPQ